MINRAAVILKYKPPAVKWINDADPYNDDPGISIASVNEERTVYLIHEEQAGTPGELEKWLKLNFRVLFETELESWYTDPELWPTDISYALFKKWFAIECHTVIEDTVGEPIVDEYF